MALTGLPVETGELPQPIGQGFPFPLGFLPSGAAPDFLMAGGLAAAAGLPPNAGFVLSGAVLLPRSAFFSSLLNSLLSMSLPLSSTPLALLAVRAMRATVALRIATAPAPPVTAPAATVNPASATCTFTSPESSPMISATDFPLFSMSSAMLAASQGNSPNCSVNHSCAASCICAGLSLVKVLALSRSSDAPCTVLLYKFFALPGKLCAKSAACLFIRARAAELVT